MIAKKKRLTSKQWYEILQNKSIATKNSYNILKAIYNRKDHKGYASEIGLELKLGDNSPQSAINLEIGRFGKRITKHYDIDLTVSKNKKYIFWDIFFIGEDEGRMFSWKLRPEITEAFQKISNNKPTPQKIARICWNYYNWTKPSGKEGKSSNKKSYEFVTKFGHEEWLFDFSKQIDGYHYTFLQSINANREKYIGKTFDIHLYSINGNTKERWWLGKINNVEIISFQEESEIYDLYKRKGWIKEMSNQLKIVDADYKTFEKEKNIFNIKFKISDTTELLDIPLLMTEKDKCITATYYTTLLNKTSDPDLYNTKKFNFIPRHNPQKRNSVIVYGKRLSEIDKLHPKIQDLCYKQLTNEFGKDNVGTEIPTGYGGSIDLVVKNKKGYVFYEIKTNKSIRICIREALSQLLEYAHFPNKNNANKFVIVSQNPITENVKKYLINIRETYKTPVFYKQFDLTKNELLNEEN